MQTERQQEAQQARSEGEKLAQEIRADGDKQQTIIVTEAERKAQTIRGEADAGAIKIYADAFGKNPEFYAFYRSLEAYNKSLADKGTTMVISPDNPFFEYFRSKKAP